MKYRVIVRPEAEDDLKEAFSWYEDKRVDWDTTFFCKLMQDLTSS
jgi:plasmid stabilization system protein ParE